jgi:hypothetical protein
MSSITCRTAHSRPEPRSACGSFHIFEFDEDGRIIRESAYELWRRTDAALADDVPADAQTIRFD